VLDGSVVEGFAEERGALLVDGGETIEESLALVLVGPIGEDHVDKLVDQRALCAGRVGFRNDQVGHGHDHGVLLGVQGAQLVAGADLRLGGAGHTEQGR